MTRPLRHYHLTILRELAAEDADIGRAEWTGCDAAAELEARGLLTFERDLYWITDAGRAVLDEADPRGVDQADAALEDLQPFGPVVPFTDSRGGQHRVQAQVFVRDGRPVEVRAGPIIPDDFLETVEAAFAEAFPTYRLRDWRAPTRDGRAVLADGLVAKVELVEEVTP